MSSDARDAGTDPEATDTGEPDASEERPVEFANRAARRAKGKRAAGQQPTSGKGSHFGGRGSVPGPRQWGNRRTG